MSKATDVQDLLGESTKKPAAKKAAKTEVAAAPAAKKAKVKAEAVEEVTAPAKKTKAAKADPEPAAKRTKEPVVFEEGEKDQLIKRVNALVKTPKNSKDLAAKLEIPTRKLRRVLYAGQKAGAFNLELGASPSQGMTVSAA